MAARITQPHRTATPPAQLPATGFIRIAQLVLLIPFSKASIWRKIQKNQFPKPVRLSENMTAWRCEDIRAWIEARASGEASQ